MSKRLPMNCIQAWFFSVIMIVICTTGCVHDPITGLPTDPANPVDTTSNGGSDFIPCEDGVVYFEYDVLPILISNCSVPGCHDDASHEDGVVLTSYDKVMATADVRPFDLDGSDLYEVITEDDAGKRMPQSPQLPLTQEQIGVIATWIQQGARNLTCDTDTLCNTQNISFALTVNPIIIANCRGCHSGPNPSRGISLADYAGIRSVAETGQLYGALARLPGYAPMPRNRGPLQDCEIAQIKAWIDGGMLNN
jgi:hypothetical protein